MTPGDRSPAEKRAPAAPLSASKPSLVTKSAGMMEHVTRKRTDVFIAEGELPRGRKS